MKKIIFTITCICILTISNAQVSKTIATTAGGLSSELTASEQNSVTNLTITGTIDARDFVILRDQMPALAVLDISAATIEAFTGSGGTAISTSYPANTIPDSAFYSIATNNGKVTLQTITFPTSITSIGNGAFNRCTGISVLTIPNSVLTIGNYAFAYCYLNNVTIGNSVISIGNGAFLYCPFTSITIPNSVSTIGHFAFRYCYYLANITVGNAVTFIGDWAFANCINLTSFFIPKLVTYIGDGAFYNNTGLSTISSGCLIPVTITSSTFYNVNKSSCYLIVPPGSRTTYSNTDNWRDFTFSYEKDFESKTLTIYNSGTLKTLLSSQEKNTIINLILFGSLDARDFVTLRDEMPQLRTLNISNASIGSYTGTEGTAGTINTFYPGSSIPEYAFYGSNIISISLPNKVVSISNASFYECSNLSELILPNNIISIGDYAFDGCSGLTNALTIPNLVSSVGYGAFNRCYGLTNITIGGSVTSIGNFAFGNCNNLQKISVISITPPIIDATTFFNINKTTCILEIPTGSTSNYLLANYWNEFTTISEKSFTTKIIDLVTAGTLSTLLTTNEKNNVTDLTIIGFIDARDFKFMRDEMLNLNILNISNAKIISYNGTSGTNSGILNYLENEIPAYSFYNIINHTARRLKNIYCPSTITKIGDYAFAFNRTLTNQCFEKSLKNIGERAFIECTSLTGSLNLTDSLITLGDYSFSGCNKINLVSIPNNVTTIGRSAFESCSNLTNLTIGNSVSYIGRSAFDGCSKLIGNLVFPNSILTIGDYAFGMSSNLTSLSFGNSITTIGNLAFTSCTGLVSINTYSNLPCDLSTSSNVFSGVNKTTCTLYVPAGSSAAYRAANQWQDFTNIVERVVTTTWNGTMWSPSPPTYVDNAIIDGNYDAPGFSCNNLTINAGKQLTIASGTLTISSNLTLKSDPSGTATLIDYPGTLSVNGITTVEQYLTGKTGETATDNWWYISSPVIGATSAIFNPASTATDKNLFGYYDELTANYPQIKTNDVTLTAGKGYVFKNGGASGTFTFAFTGPLHSGDTTITVTRTGVTAGKRGFNLIGNPYPSFLNWNSVRSAAVLNSNVRPTIWYRTRTSRGEMTFDTFDGLIGTDNGKNGMVSQYIPPLQAFWMKLDADNSSATLTFANSMRSHQDQSSSINCLRAPKSDLTQIVRLKVSNGINSDAAVIVADPNAIDEYDDSDSQKMPNNNVNIPEIYTLAGSEELVINHLNNFSANKELILGFRPGKTGKFTIEATEISNLDSNLKVMLIDNFTTEEHELKIGSLYSFTSDATETNNHFIIRFKSTSVTTGISNAKNNENVLVYTNLNHKITVICDFDINKSTTVSVYNEIGQKLTQQRLFSTTSIINGIYNPGIYLVTVNNGEQIFTKKVIVK